MVQASPPQLDPTVFNENLAALQRTEPQLAERVAGLARVIQAASGVTRDGQISFRVGCSRPDGRPSSREQWLGRTSIPAVRAAALLDRFDAGLGNVLLPGLGQGYEATLLLQRLARCRAVFVWEPEEGVLVLGLRLHDWAAAIAERRLVLLGGPVATLTTTLVNWFNVHPGHLCPTRILMWPWAAPPELAEIRAAVQAAYEIVEQARVLETSRIRQQLAEALSAVAVHDPAGGGTHVTGGRTSALVLSLQPRDEVLALGDVLAAALSTAGEQAEYVAVRSAADVHSLARIRRIAGIPGGPPGQAILLNTTRQEVRDVLPEPIPAISWLETHAIPASGLAGQIGDRDLIAVTHARGYARALEAGIEPGRLKVCPLPCLAIPSDPAGLANADRPIDVVIMTDLPLTGAERFGYSLPTHLQLWGTAIELLGAGIDGFTDEQGESVLAAAEKRLGLRIDDLEVRRPMLEILSTTVANALLWRRLFRALVQAGVKPAVCGHGWSDVAGHCWQGPMTSLRDRARIAGQAKLVIHADVTGELSHAALLAVGSGAVLLARAHPSDRRPGGWHTLFEPDRSMLTFRREQELTRLVRRLIGDSAGRRSLARLAAEAVKSQHTPEARLVALRSSASSCSSSSRVQS
ncbi:MAG TPA: glycosyltransferase [Phycisphaerae bacterium]|nr:glycosyltransferase [Phycisphaerae bacterium]HRY66525.1 glycosyltransferase [Phycisphaerae bacterium]HSA28637.1 glycosyltransferase [Phycisphaerae bacterium]